jgi:hypothetical protein
MDPGSLNQPEGCRLRKKTACLFNYLYARAEHAAEKTPVVENKFGFGR